jgi:hypothetical protein
LKVVASGIVDKYIGESARVIREMFSKRSEILIPIAFAMSLVSSLLMKSMLLEEEDFLTEPAPIGKSKEP